MGGAWFRWTPEIDDQLQLWRQEGVKRDVICERLGCSLRQLKKRCKDLDLPPSNAKAEPNRKTHAEFIAEMAERHPDAEVLGEYTTGLEPVLIRCKACGHEAPVIPNNALRQGYCRVCGDVEGAVTRALGVEETRQRLTRLFPGYQFDSFPERQDQRVHFTCDVGHRDSGIAKDLLAGKGCLKCAQMGVDSVPLFLRQPERAEVLVDLYYVQHKSGRHKIGIAQNGADHRGGSDYVQTFLELRAKRAEAWAVEQVMLRETIHRFDEQGLIDDGWEGWGGWTELREPLPVEATCRRINELLSESQVMGWLNFYAAETGYRPKKSVRELFSEAVQTEPKQL